MKKLIVIMIVIIALAPIKVEAGKSSEGKAIIRFQLTAKDKYRYEVEVRGRGKLKEGAQEIREGIIEYSLSVGEVKVFKVEADRGYELERIEYNGKEIEKGKEEIRIPVVSGNRKLKVEFKKKETIDKGGAGIFDNTEKDKPDTKGNASQLINKKIKGQVKTGDIRKDKYLISVGLMIVMIYMLKKRDRH